MLSGKHNMFEWYEVEDYPEVSLFKGTDKELTILSRVFYETQWGPPARSQERKHCVLRSKKPWRP